MLLRAVEETLTGKWRPQVLNVSHSVRVKERQRKNSALTHIQQSLVEDLVAKGKRPKYMRNQANLEQIRKGVVEKNPAGNIVGKCELMQMV